MFDQPVMMRLNSDPLHRQARWYTKDHRSIVGTIRSRTLRVYESSLLSRGVECRGMVVECGSQLSQAP